MKIFKKNFCNIANNTVKTKNFTFYKNEINKSLENLFTVLIKEDKFKSKQKLK
jgi:hypothetical protein